MRINKVSLIQSNIFKDMKKSYKIRFVDYWCYNKISIAITKGYIPTTVDLENEKFHSIYFSFCSNILSALIITT